MHPFQEAWHKLQQGELDMGTVFNNNKPADPPMTDTSRAVEVPKKQRPDWFDAPHEDGEWPGWVYELRERCDDSERAMRRLAEQLQAAEKEANRRVLQAEMDAARRKEQRDHAREVADEKIDEAHDAKRRVEHLNEVLANLFEKRQKQPKTEVVVAPPDHKLQDTAIEYAVKAEKAQTRLEELQQRYHGTKAWSWFWFLGELVLGGLLAYKQGWVVL